MINFSIWKIFGIFASLIMLGLFFGGTIINAGKAIKDGDFKTALKETGGRVFLLDNILIEETEYLTTPNEDANFEKSFHFIYSLSVIFLFFMVVLILFKLGNWMSGKSQWSPSTDILIVCLILILFFTLQFLYAIIFLDKTIWPFKGIYTFLRNMPEILRNLIV